MRPASHPTGWSDVRRTLGLLRYVSLREARPALQALRDLPLNVLDILDPRRGAARIAGVQQSVLVSDAGLPQLESLDEVQQQLAARGIRAQRDNNGLYAPPQSRLSNLFGDIAAYLPEDTALRIPTPGVAPSADDQTDVAGVLYALGLGPRLYDRMQLTAGSSRFACLLVEHVDGEPASAEERAAFVKRLRRIGVERSGPRFKIAQRGVDFLASGILERRRDARVLAVDPRVVVLDNRQANLRRVLGAHHADFHFGGTRLLRGGRYLYQSVPGLERGKRDTQPRWKLIQGLLEDANLSVDRRVVMDVGCNAAMMLASAMGSGANWGVGWDRPAIVAGASRVQAVLGNTRLDLIGAEVDDQYPLLESVPPRLRSHLEQGVVLYLAVWRWLGFLPQLAELPWKALVFEGHQADSQDEHEANLRLMQDRWRCRVIARSAVLDGDSQPRPLALLVRDA